MTRCQLMTLNLLLGFKSKIKNTETRRRASSIILIIKATFSLSTCTFLSRLVTFLPLSLSLMSLWPLIGDSHSKLIISCFSGPLEMILRPN